MEGHDPPLLLGTDIEEGNVEIKNLLDVFKLVITNCQGN